MHRTGMAAFAPSRGSRATPSTATVTIPTMALPAHTALGGPLLEVVEHLLRDLQPCGLRRRLLLDGALPHLGRVGVRVRVRVGVRVG
eukprot:scaffold116094_cov39-Phaeocystis_antarctica.AAC.2